MVMNGGETLSLDVIKTYVTLENIYMPDSDLKLLPVI
jgi:hypothetical protein